MSWQGGIRTNNLFGKYGFFVEKNLTPTFLSA